PPQKSFLEKCVSGQRKVRAFLQTSHAKTLIQRSKEKELRWSAALGDWSQVEQLLQEGVDPVSPDGQGRTPLDYASSRFEMVKERQRIVCEEKADPMTLKERIEKSKVALENHPK